MPTGAKPKWIVAEPGPRHTASNRMGHAVKRRNRRGIIIALSCLAAVLIIGGSFAGWVGVRGLEARDALVRAQSLVGQIQDAAGRQDFAAAAAAADRLTVQTEIAVERTSDPIWHIAEGLPWVGSNFKAVRRIAEIVHDVNVDAVQPIVALTHDNFAALKPVDGRLDVQAFEGIGDTLSSAKNSLILSSAGLAAVDTSQAVSQVSDAKKKLMPLLSGAVKSIGEIDSTVALLPSMLGGEGVRQYILLFQNNAEATALGGNTAAWVILTVDNGSLVISDQPNSRDFSRKLAAPLGMPADTLRVYKYDYFRYATNITIRPDFPSDALMAQAFWARQSGVQVDGVIAFDPIALSYLLEATGPLTLPTGQELNSGNAVKLLLSDVYSMYDVPTQQDAFFAGAAATVFSALTGSGVDLPLLVDALGRAVEDDRFMAWSSHPEEQALITGTQLEGALKKDNLEETQIGVFFTENSASKMSYYMKSALTLTSTQCSTPEAPTFTATVSLNSDISMADYRALPAYVRSGAYFDPIKTRTLVFVYGPPGSTYKSWSWNKTGMGATLEAKGTDLGRPVVQISVDMRPGEQSRVEVVFTAPPGEYGELSARVTPMINPTGIELLSPGCS